MICILICCLWSRLESSGQGGALEIISLHALYHTSFLSKLSSQNHGEHHASPGFMLCMMVCIMLRKTSSTSHFIPLISVLARGTICQAIGGIRISNSRQEFIFRSTLLAALAVPREFARACAHYRLALAESLIKLTFKLSKTSPTDF